MWSFGLQVNFFLVPQCNGKEILWSHHKDLYELENDPAKTVPGTRIVPKLKYEHIHLIPFSKMSVDLAAQVSCLVIFVYGILKCYCISY